MDLNMNSQGGVRGIMDLPRSARRVENGRLVWYSRRADANYWDHYWSDQISQQTYSGAEVGKLGSFQPVFARFLPKTGRILEAGCGVGQIVLALRVLGYDVEGVEWGPETVQSVKRLKPDLPIRVGDVTKLGVPDGWYAAYISVGVVEHRKDGPQPFLREAWRVLQPGGIALISVPYFNPLRRLKALLQLYRDQAEDLDFYQYAFAETEFHQLLIDSGFQVIDHLHYSTTKGIDDELPQLRRLAKHRPTGRLAAMLYRSLWFNDKCAHMTMAVCRKSSKQSVRGS